MSITSARLSRTACVYVSNVDPTEMMHMLKTRDMSVLDSNNEYVKPDVFNPRFKPCTEQQSLVLYHVANRLTAMITEMEQLETLMEVACGNML